MSEYKRFADLYKQVKELISSAGGGSEALAEVAKLLQQEVDHYDWVGFYLAENKTGSLTLGPFAGEPTEHTEIDYGEGVCGQAAESKETFTVQDVEQEDNYLSCSPEVKSEIVVPVFRDQSFVGEIDIDSHEAGVFDSEDEKFLEDLGEELAPYF